MDSEEQIRYGKYRNERYCFPSRSPTALNSARTLSSWGTFDGSGSTRSLR